MLCQDAKNWINAWVDGELDPDRAALLENHLSKCRVCAREAAQLQKLAAALDVLPPVPIPSGVRRRTMARFRAGFNQANVLDWWKGLGVAMRGAACGAALTGLVFGIALGASLTALSLNTSANDYLAAVYHTGGLLP